MKKSYVMFLTLFVSIFFFIPKIGKATDYGYCMYTQAYNSSGTKVSYGKSGTGCGQFEIGVNASGQYITQTNYKYAYKSFAGEYAISLTFENGAIVCPTIYVYVIDTLDDAGKVTDTICYLSSTSIDYSADTIKTYSIKTYTYTIDSEAPEASTGSSFNEYWNEQESKTSSTSSTSTSSSTDTSIDYDDICSEDNIQVIMKILGYLLTVVHIVVPLLLIVMGSIDFYESIVANDGKDYKIMNKSLSAFIARLISAVVIFFIPTIVKLIFNIIEPDWKNETGYYSCVACVLDTSECGS